MHIERYSTSSLLKYQIERSETDVISGAGSFSANSKVQKSKPQRSQYNLSQSTVQKVISGDPTALATLANLPIDNCSGPYSDTSSQPPSAASSTSSTPRIDAIGSGLPSEQLRGISHFQSNSSQDSPWSSVYERPSTAQTTVSNQSVVEAPKKSCCCSNESEEPAVSSESTTPFTANAQDPRPLENRPLGQQQTQTPFDIYNAEERYSIHPAHHLPGFNTDFSAYELAVGCDGIHSSPMAHSINEHKDCHCGDTCDCFACATHPNNRATIDYVRYHNDLFMRSEYGHLVRYNSQSGPPYVMSYQPYNPSQHPVAGIHREYGQPIRQTFNIQQPYNYQNVGWPRSMPPPMPPVQTPTAGVESMHFENVSQAMAPPQLPGYDANMHILHDQQYRSVLQHYVRSENSTSVSTETMPATPRVLAGIVNASLDTAESPEDSSTLSPSSFLLQQFTLPDCSNESGTCLCGEGCSCVGCLTHSGHDVVQSTKEVAQSNNDVETFLLEESK
jgi:hypothetical protein